MVENMYMISICILKCIIEEYVKLYKQINFNSALTDILESKIIP